MNNNLDYTDELEKIIGIFNYKGCRITKWGNGFFIWNKFCQSLEEVDKVIDASIQSLSKSILK